MLEVSPKPHSSSSGVKKRRRPTSWRNGFVSCCFAFAFGACATSSSTPVGGGGGGGASHTRGMLALLKRAPTPSSFDHHAGGAFKSSSSSSQRKKTITMTSTMPSSSSTTSTSQQQQQIKDTWSFGGSIRVHPAPSSSSSIPSTTTKSTDPSILSDEDIMAMMSSASTNLLQSSNKHDASLPSNLQAADVEVEIRPALVEELPLIVDLRAQVFGGGGASPDWRIHSLRNLLQRRQKGAVCLIATARKKENNNNNNKPVLVGSVEFSSHEFVETGISPCLSEETTSAPKLYMTGVAVAEAYRRQGVASTLLQAVDEHALSLGAPYICMFVDSGNPAALSLYSKSGFMLVNYSPLAEAFASAIGLYKGPYSGRQFAFVYKRLPAKPQTRPSFGVLSSSSPFQVKPSPSVSSSSDLLLQPFPSRMPDLASEWEGTEDSEYEEGLVANLLHGGLGGGEDIAHRLDP